MNEKKNIKVITNSGFRYSGPIIKDDTEYLTIKDKFEGNISIPKKNISFIKEVEKWIS